MTTMKLRAPITEGGKQITEITFRKALGKDVRQCGMPLDGEVTANGGRINHVNTESVARYISALANIPPSTVDQMHPTDFTEAVAIIAGFFEETSSTDATSSDESSTTQTPSN